MTSKMRDSELTLTERIDAALRRVTNGEGTMRVPVEATDPDIVLADCRLAVAALHELLDVERMRQRLECHKAADTAVTSIGWLAGAVSEAAIDEGQHETHLHQRADDRPT